MNTPLVGDRWMPLIKGKQEKKHIHEYKSYQIIQEPSCTIDGIGRYVCECGAHDPDDIVISATGHTFGEWYDVSAPECTNPGLRMRDCLHCMFAEDDTIDPKGHTFNELFTVDKSATCMTDGSRSRHCEYCDAITDDTIIPRLDHDRDQGQHFHPSVYGEGTGVRIRYTCKRCNITFIEQIWDCEYRGEGIYCTTGFGTGGVLCPYFCGYGMIDPAECIKWPVSDGLIQV